VWLKRVERKDADQPRRPLKELADASVIAVALQLLESVVTSHPCFDFAPASSPRVYAQECGMGPRAPACARWRISVRMQEELLFARARSVATQLDAFHCIRWTRLQSPPVCPPPRLVNHHQQLFVAGTRELANFARDVHVPMLQQVHHGAGAAASAVESDWRRWQQQVRGKGPQGAGWRGTHPCQVTTLVRPHHDLAANAAATDAESE